MSDNELRAPVEAEAQEEAKQCPCRRKSFAECECDETYLADAAGYQRGLAESAARVAQLEATIAALQQQNHGG